MDPQGETRSTSSDPPDEATAWLARRLDAKTWTARDEAALEQWLAASPDHVREMQKAVEAWELMSQPGVFHLDEIHHTLSKYRAPEKAKYGRRWLLPTGITLGVAAAVAVGLFIFFAGDTYTTNIGERRKVVLEDGSVMHLDAASKVVCHFSKGHRLIELKAGGAVFEVTSVPDRPFEVRGAGCTIRDIGTTFDVHLREGKKERGAEQAAPEVEVSVEEGEVEIRSSGTADTAALRLVAGEQVVWNANVAHPKKRKTAAGSFALWRDGRLRYREQPLRYLIADLQRHSGRVVVLADSHLGQLEVSGTFRSENLDEALQALREILPLTFSKSADGTTVIQTDSVRKKP